MSQFRGRWAVKGGKSSVMECLQGSSPLPPLVSPRFFFFIREFFSRALLSERLQQASYSLPMSHHAIHISIVDVASV